MPKSMKPLKLYIAVGIGGTIGAIGRHGITYIVSWLKINQAFPWATLIANLLGSFLLSYLLFHPWIKKKLNLPLFTALTTGVLGAFTTYSTVVSELFFLFETKTTLALLYISISLIGGL